MASRMNKKFLALLLALAMILVCVPITTGAASAVSAKVTARASFDKDSLSTGTLTASVGAFESPAEGPRKFFAAIIYCSADGQLLDFSAAAIETREPYPGIGIYSATAVLTLDIPEDVSEGQYVKAIVLDGNTLEPLTVPDNILYCEGSEPEPAPRDEQVYKGMFERYYTLDGEDGSIAIIQEGSKKYIRVSDTGTPFRLKDMTDDYVGFVDTTDTQRRLQVSGGAPGRGIYAYGGSTAMLWKLIPAEDKYYVQSSDGSYLAIENNEVVMSMSPYAFSLTFAYDSPFTRMTSLPGFKLFTEEEQQRIIDICTSVGAAVFPRGTATGGGNAFIDKLETSFTQIYNISQNITAEAQKERILNALKSPIYSGTDDFVSLNPIPGGDAEIIQADPRDEYLEIWDLGWGTYKRIDVTYKTADATQTIPFYTNDLSYANVKNAIEALAKFPYKYRQYLEKVCIYASTDSNSAYYCDGPVLTVRLRGIATADMMARSFAHELGHSIDMAGGGDFENKATHWCQTAEWQQVFTDDLVIISDYGNQIYDTPNDPETNGKHNYYEELAEFARLYFQCHGNRDREIGLKQLFPNHYESFGRLLNRSGMEHFF